MKPSLSSAILRRRWAVIGLQIAFGVLVVAIWQALTAWHIVMAFALPLPGQVAMFIGHWFRTGTIWIQIGATLEVTLIGFAVGVAAGTVLGVLMGTVTFIKYYMEAFLAFFNAVPRLIIIPIFIVWLGFGNEPQILIVVLVNLFLIAAVVQAGIDEIQGVLVNHARALGATWLQLLRTVYLPGVGIWIVSVSRQAFGHAITAAAVTEFFGAQKGLGYLIEQGLISFNTREMYSAILVTSGVGVLFDFVLRRIDRRASRYLAR
jgi:NitT/TauT family transport system permease protein